MHRHSTAPCKKPSPSHPVVVKPQQIARAGFGVIVFALDLAVPPAAGEDVGAGEFVDVAVFGTQDEPAVFVAVIRAAGETQGLMADAADQHIRSGEVQVVQIVQPLRLVQNVCRKFDLSERLPGKSRFGQMAVGKFGADHRVVAELGAQTRQRAVGGFEVARRFRVK